MLSTKSNMVESKLKLFIGRESITDFININHKN